MVNAPTNSAMNAKTSSAVEKKPSAWLIESVLSLTTVCPVTTSTPGGRTAAMARCTAALLAPGAVTTLMSSSLPVSWAMACAVGSVNAASVAPARLFAVPNWAMPVMVKVRGGPGGQDADLLADGEVVLLRRPGVHHHVVGGHRRAARGQVQRGHPLVRVVGHADGGRAAAGRDGLAVPGHELGVAGDLAVGGRDAGHPADRGQQRLGQLVAGRARAAAELGDAADLEVDLGVDAAEQRGERVLQGVGQDERPGDERDPEDDRQRGQRQPELVGQQALERDVTHLTTPSSRIRSSTESAVGWSSSLTTAPSARKTTRSA